MEDRDYIVLLYDYYQDLFNDNQRECFEYYYFDNLSLSEIGMNMDKSRNAIHKMIKSVCNKLYFYEEKLKLYEKSNEIRNIINIEKNEDIKERLGKLL